MNLWLLTLIVCVNASVPENMALGLLSNLISITHLWVLSCEDYVKRVLSLVNIVWKSLFV